MWEKREKIVVLLITIMLLSNSVLIQVQGNEGFKEDRVFSEKSDINNGEFTFENPITIYTFTEMIYVNDLIYLFDATTIKILNVSIPDNHEELYSYQFQSYDFYYQDNDHWFLLPNDIFLNINHGLDYSDDEYQLFFNFYKLNSSGFILLYSNKFIITNHNFMYSSCYCLNDQVFLLADSYKNYDNPPRVIHDSYLLTYNISNISNVTLTNEYSFAALDYYYHGFEIKEDIIFFNSFERLDFRNLSDPSYSLLNQIIFDDENGRAIKLLDNDILEIINFQSGYQQPVVNEDSFYDITDITNPIELYTLTFPEYWRDKIIQDDLVICSSGNSLRFYDISNKEDPTILSEFEVKKQGIGSFQEIIVVDNYLYATRDCEYKEFMFYIFDISDLSEPVKLFPFGTSLSSQDKEKIFTMIVILIYAGIPILVVIGGGLLIFYLVKKRKKKIIQENIKMNSNENLE